MAILCLAVFGSPPGVFADEPLRGAQPKAPPEAVQRLEESDAQRDRLLASLLNSGDPRQVAWGAYEAGRRGAKALVPRLVELVSQDAEDQTGAAWKAARRAVWAALVDLEAKLSGNVLVEIWGQESEMAAILAVAWGTDEATLRLFQLAAHKQPSASPELVALGNRLAARKTRGFAYRLMESMPLQLYVVAHSDAAKSAYAPPSNGIPWSGRMNIPAGFPPVVFHTLRGVPTAAARVLSVGVRTVYVVRYETPGTDVMVGGVFGAELYSEPGTAAARLSWQEACRWWIDAMLPSGVQTPGGLPGTRECANIVWNDTKSFVASAQAASRAVFGRYYAIAQELIDAGCMSFEQARLLAPVIQTRVVDQRDGGSTLPALPEIELVPPRNPFLADRKSR